MNISITPGAAGSRPWGGDDATAPAAVGGAAGKLVLPGEQIAAPEGFMRGHGTFEEDGQITAAICGVVRTVNKLIYVAALRSRYTGDTGDVVVGRVDEVGQGKWLVDVGGHRRAQLQLAAINLPGSEQRRRTVSDQLEMRRFFSEGELASTEVQRVQNDGVVLLHTRNARYGRLQNGCYVKVPPQLVRRQQQHLLTLPNGVHLTLGNNGQIWIAEPPTESHLDTLNFVHGETAYKTVAVDLRRRIAMVRQCILALAAAYLEVTPEAIMTLVRAAEHHGYSAKEVLHPGVAERLCGELLAAADRSAGNSAVVQ